MTEQREKELRERVYSGFDAAVKAVYSLSVSEIDGSVRADVANELMRIECRVIAAIRERRDAA